MNFVIDDMSDADWSGVSRIYVEGIETGNATFEVGAPSWQEWDTRHLPFARLVARRGGELIGWSALSPVSAREVYAGVAEVSVYVSRAHRGEGVGILLLEALVAASEANGIWTLQAGIFPENEASLRIHEKCGFRVVGVRRRIGRMNGKWRDVVLLERRSEVSGKD